MVNILVLGGTGMLGSTVVDYLSLNQSFDVSYTYRVGLAHPKLDKAKKAIYFEPKLNAPLDLSFVGLYDYVINCIGIIKPFMENNYTESIYLNSVFPHLLSKACKEFDAKLIHITTDCVFSGNTGSYNESSLHDALDNYGKSKSLGEPQNCCTLRTSIIGDEVHKNASLFSWVLAQKTDINGYTNAIWNGITTRQFAKICEQIISQNLYFEGIKHIYSNKVTKLELVQTIVSTASLPIEVKPFKIKQSIDMSLSTIHPEFINKLDIPTIKEQIEYLWQNLQ